MPEASYGQSSRWLSVCLVDAGTFGANPETIRQALERENIEARPVWKPMHLQPVFRGMRIFGGNVSERLYQNGLCLPSGLDLTSGDQDRVCAIVKKCQRQTTQSKRGESIAGASR
jgi:dTDP-4-amino-4,6-dideoxygalactose transaminase